LEKHALSIVEGRGRGDFWVEWGGNYVVNFWERPSHRRWWGEPDPERGTDQQKNVPPLRSHQKTAGSFPANNSWAISKVLRGKSTYACVSCPNPML